MKRIYTTVLGLSLLFGAVACGSDSKQDDDINKAKIEAEQKAKEMAKNNAIKALKEAKSIEGLNSIFNALPKEVKENQAVKEAMKAKKTELEQKAKDEAEKQKAEAMQKAKEYAIEALNEVENLESLKTTFEGFPKEIQEDPDVKKLMETRKTEFEQAAKEKAEKEKVAKWLEGKTFVFKRVDKEEGVNTVLTLIFQEKYTFISKNQMGMGNTLIDMTEDVKGTYKYIKPILKLKYKKVDLTGGASYGDVKFVDVTEEYQVDEEKEVITAIIDDETCIFKLQK